jgi:hypothetical protein
MLLALLTSSLAAKKRQNLETKQQETFKETKQVMSRKVMPSFPDFSAKEVPHLRKHLHLTAVAGDELQASWHDGAM